MNTLFDIIALGNKADAAGNPLTHNWTQVRGCAAFFGRACGGLDQCPIDTFETRFPEDFKDLAPGDQGAFPSHRAYVSARAQIIQTLIQIGLKKDPWERLYGLIRKTNRRDRILNYMSGLKTPAIKDGLAPADISADWVWSLETEAEKGSRRQRLRQAVVMFDSLFDIDDIATSGVLPPSRIGPPPSTDRYGREALPPNLMSYQAGLERAVREESKSALPRFWKAITAAGGLGLPGNPSAQDILNIWPDIRSLPSSSTGLAKPSWRSLHQAVRRILTRYANTPAAEVLPAHFKAMAETDYERWALKTLWRQMLNANIDTPEMVTAHDLLALGTWRSLWCNKPEGMSVSTFAPYEIRARKILLRHSPGQIDPLRRVTRAWADLPKPLKVDLAPARKAAQKAFLRPLDVTREWLSGIDLDAEQRARIDTALNTAAATEASPPAPPASPAEIAWRKLRETAEKQGVGTFGLGPVETWAIQDGRLPSTIDRAWAIQISTSLPKQSQRAKFRMALRLLDGLLDVPLLAPLLYSQKIEPLPDLRRRGAVDMPDDMARELETIYNALGFSESYCREARATVCKLLSAAAVRGLRVETLEQALNQAEALAPDLMTLKKAGKIKKNLARHVSQASAS